MESLSELLRSLPGDSRFRQVEEAVHKLFTDAQLMKWRAKNPAVTDSDIRLHLNVLYQYVKEQRNCSRCPGLDKCPNDFAGHYSVLSSETLDGVSHIYDSKAACSKYITKQSQDAIRSRIRSFYVDEASLEQGYSSDEILDIDPDRMPIVGRVILYIEKTIQSGLQPKGLYLSGDLGVGKTFLMCYMLHELAKKGLAGAIVYMPDFSEDLKAMFSEPQKLKDTIDMLKETDLLIFDDIGAENMSPWLRDHVLGSILNYRINRKPTFYTSNHTLDSLEKHFSFTSKDGEEEFKGKRIMDRIRPFVDELQLEGFNKRGR